MFFRLTDIPCHFGALRGTNLYLALQMIDRNERDDAFLSVPFSVEVRLMAAYALDQSAFEAYAKAFEKSRTDLLEKTINFLS